MNTIFCTTLLLCSLIFPQRLTASTKNKIDERSPLVNNDPLLLSLKQTRKQSNPFSPLPSSYSLDENDEEKKKCCYYFFCCCLPCCFSCREKECCFLSIKSDIVELSASNPSEINPSMISQRNPSQSKEESVDRKSSLRKSNTSGISARSDSCYATISVGTRPFFISQTSTSSSYSILMNGQIPLVSFCNYGNWYILQSGIIKKEHNKETIFFLSIPLLIEKNLQTKQQLQGIFQALNEGWENFFSISSYNKKDIDLFNQNNFRKSQSDEEITPYDHKIIPNKNNVISYPIFPEQQQENYINQITTEFKNQNSNRNDMLIMTNTTVLFHALTRCITQGITQGNFITFGNNKFSEFPLYSTPLDVVSERIYEQYIMPLLEDSNALFQKESIFSQKRSYSTAHTPFSPYSSTATSFHQPLEKQ